MPKAPGLHRVQVHVALLHLRILVEFQGFPRHRARTADIHDAIRGPLAGVVRHERERERPTLAGEPSHLVYGIIQSHGYKFSPVSPAEKDKERSGGPGRPEIRPGTPKRPSNGAKTAVPEGVSHSFILVSRSFPDYWAVPTEKTAFLRDGRPRPPSSPGVITLRRKGDI